MPEIQIMSTKGDTTLMYSLEYPEQYREVKKQVVDGLKHGAFMHGVVNGQKIKLADSYMLNASAQLEFQDPVDKALLAEDTHERVLTIPLMGG